MGPCAGRSAQQDWPDSQSAWGTIKIKEPERSDQYGIARARFALARQIYKQLLAREPNNKIALVRLVFSTSNQAGVAGRLGDDILYILGLREDQIKCSRRLFDIDNSNPYFAALLATGLMIEAGKFAALTGDNDDEVSNAQKPLCRRAFRLAEEALEITQRNLREDLFSTYRRICLKLGYSEELARIDELERTAKSRAPIPNPSQSASATRPTTLQNR